MTVEKCPSFQHGDDSVGYRLDIFKPFMKMPARFEVKMWGLWKDEVMMAKFESEVRICFKILSAYGSWNVYGDLERYRVQPLQVGQLIAKLMEEAKDCGFKKAAVVSKSAAVRLFIMGLTVVARMENLRCFETKEEAEDFLRRS